MNIERKIRKFIKEHPWELKIIVFKDHDDIFEYALINTNDGMLNIKNIFTGVNIMLTAKELARKIEDFKSYGYTVYITTIDKWGCEVEKVIL